MSPRRVRVAHDRGVALFEYTGLLLLVAAILGAILAAFSACADRTVKPRTAALSRAALQRDTQSAIEAARKALENDDCNNAISGPRLSGEDARDVLDHVAITDYQTFDNQGHDLGISTFGKGSRGKITFFGMFHRTPPNRFYYPLAKFKDGRNNLTEAEFQTLAVLHEVGHLTGANQPEPPGEPGAAFNETILRECLGVIE